MKTDKKAFKQMEELSIKLNYTLDNIKMEKLYTNYLNQNKQEEKDHRRFSPDINLPITITQSAKLFSVKNIIEYALHLTSYYPCVDDYLHLRKSCFIALALAINYTDEIIECLDGFDVEAILYLDYAQIMQDGLT